MLEEHLEIHYIVKFSGGFALRPSAPLSKSRLQPWDMKTAMRADPNNVSTVESTSFIPVDERFRVAWNLD